MNVSAAHSTVFDICQEQFCASFDNCGDDCLAMCLRHFCRRRSHRIMHDVRLEPAGISPNLQHSTQRTDSKSFKRKIPLEAHR
ncbi:hypothetical protein M758_3G146500, partial [Ceratodon purpureus]